MNSFHKSNGSFYSTATRVSLLLLPLLIGTLTFSGKASATHPPEPQSHPHPVVPTPVYNNPTAIAAPTAEATAQSGSLSTSGAKSVINSSATTRSGEATTNSGPASTASGSASTESGAASTLSGSATTAAGNVTNVLRTGENSFLYLPNPVQHPNVNLTAGAYVYAGRVYVMCPTASSEWHVTAYVLGAGASHTSDQMPTACGALIASAQAVDAVGSLLELLQYMDVQLRQAYAISAADQMLRVIGARPADLTRVRVVEGGSRSQQIEQRELRIRVIQEGTKVPASN